MRLLPPLIITSAAFVALAALVAHGELSGVDRYSLRHLMEQPSTDPGLTAPLLEKILGYPRHVSVGSVIVFPASGAVATAGIVALAVALWRRGKQALSLAFVVLYAVGNGIESVCKALVNRPPLRVTTGTGSFHVGSLDSSFPSGHALRAMMVATGAVLLWRRLLPLGVACVVTIVVALEVAGYHTPTDIAGGVLLATALVLLLAMLQKGPALERLELGTHSPESAI